MLLTIAVLALLSAAYLLFRYAKRQTDRIPDNNTVLPLPPAGARPLFEPDAAELRAAARETEARDIARREDSDRTASREAVKTALNEWRRNTNSRTAAELLRVCAGSGDQGQLEIAAEEILKVYRESGVTGLNDGDMAALIDSHLRLAPSGRRDAGALFWLTQEVARLRSE